MTRLTRVCRAVGVGLATVTATLAMTQAASAAPAPPTAPAELAPPPGNEAFLVAPAKGVQIYKCTKNTDSATSATTPFKWVFDHPEATLTGDNGQIITHDAGPIWKAPDGSSVTGSAAIRFPAVFDPATAKDIQQLRLTGTPSGTGLLAATTFIQRLNTQGGTQPPAAECKEQTLGKVKEVPYKADYVFFKKTA